MYNLLRFKGDQTLSRIVIIMLKNEIILNALYFDMNEIIVMKREYML